MSHDTAKLSVLLFVSLLFITGCIIDYSDWRLVVANQSPANIYVNPQSDTFEPSPAARIGFMLPKYLIKSKDSIKMKMTGGKKAWEGFANEAPDKKLHLYVFSEDTLKQYTTEQVIRGKKYLRRLDISLEELKANNWKVIYTD